MNKLIFHTDNETRFEYVHEPIVKKTYKINVRKQSFR